MLHVLAAIAISGIVPFDLAGQKPRDLVKLDACKILTSADLAAATETKSHSTAGARSIASM